MSSTEPVYRASTFKQESSSVTWNQALASLPNAHALQSWVWGDFKSRWGWSAQRLTLTVAQSSWEPLAAAQVLKRRIPHLPYSILYVPKGPALDYTNSAHVSAVLDHLQQMARQRRAIWLKIDPDVIAGTGIPGGVDDNRPPHADPTGQQAIATLTGRAWRFSASQVQFRNTVTLDLTPDADAILMDMNQSTRRKVRTGEKKDVSVRVADQPGDLQTLYDLYTVTGERQGFLIRPLDYYRQAWARFIEAGLAVAFLAEFEGQPLAGLVMFHFGPKAWYFYGMSSNEERNRMPTYALQWAAIQWAKDHGYGTYDFWGAPDTFSEDNPMWGVYRFKDGFGGQVVRHIGAWDYVPNPALYWAYEHAMPRVLGAMRRLRR